MKKYIFVIAALFAAVLTVLNAPQASAQVTCAHVRCAGPCTDTPRGPVCAPKLTCANTLCKRGYVCKEKRNGPACVKGNNGHHTPLPPHHKKKNKRRKKKRAAQFCPTVYKPVCAVKKVQCVRAPCPAQRKTFGNACEASRDGYRVVKNGQCRQKRRR